jgi:hypothetical protein
MSVVCGAGVSPIPVYVALHYILARLRFSHLETTTGRWTVRTTLVVRSLAKMFLCFSPLPPLLSDRLVVQVIPSERYRSHFVPSYLHLEQGNERLRVLFVSRFAGHQSLFASLDVQSMKWCVVSFLADFCRILQYVKRFWGPNVSLLSFSHTSGGLLLF